MNQEITNETALINARLNDLQLQLGVVETAKAVNAIRASTERLNALAAIPEPVAEPAAPVEAVEPIAPEPVAVVEAPKAEPVAAKAKPVRKVPAKKAAVKAEPVKKTAKKAAKK
jgi:hypothetical protein